VVVRALQARVVFLAPGYDHNAQSQRLFTAKPLPIEDYNSPFLFVVNKELYAQSVFLVPKTLPEISEEYFRIIISKYFKTNV
jgi:hypothetical protein